MTNFQKGGKRAIPNDKPRFDNDSPLEDRSKRSRTSDLFSDDESEYSLNEFEGFEVANRTLGASAPSQITSEYTSSAMGHPAYKHRPGAIRNPVESLSNGHYDPHKQNALPRQFQPHAQPRPVQPRPAQPRQVQPRQVRPHIVPPPQPPMMEKPTFTLGAQKQQPQPKQNAALSGTYDVFAPPGPIGIVVDTSKYGPAVHSLKATSPMLGLVSPGDLIIALDDDDTRTMNAASLTRLMAKKSRQKERKITLISQEDL